MGEIEIEIEIEIVKAEEEESRKIFLVCLSVCLSVPSEY